MDLHTKYLEQVLSSNKTELSSMEFNLQLSASNPRTKGVINLINTQLKPQIEAVARIKP